MQNRREDLVLRAARRVWLFLQLLGLLYIVSTVLIVLTYHCCHKQAGYPARVRTGPQERVKA